METSETEIKARPEPVASEAASNARSAVAALKYIVDKLGGKADIRQVLLILYFADRLHLAMFGRPVVEDEYIAMKSGPQPKWISREFEALRLNHNGRAEARMDLPAHFRFEDAHVVALVNSEINMDCLSETDADCLHAACLEHKYLTMWALEEKARDYAWQHADADNHISIYDMARAGGANEALIEYMEITAENDRAVIC